MTNGAIIETRGLKKTYRQGDLDVHALRVTIFVVCAVLGSVSGSLFAHYTGYVSVASFTIDKAILFLLIPVLGGVASIAGVVVGALFITFVPELLSKLGDFHGIVFGLALIVVVIAAPQGIVGTIERWLQRTPADPLEPASSGEGTK